MFQIDSVPIPGRLILAPLAGYSDLPFRLHCREKGAALGVSEMISCHGLVYRQERTLRLLASHPGEKPVSFQLFGSDPTIMGEATSILCGYNPDIIDINMGCPVRKVTKRGAGAALMTDIDLARKIIRQVVAHATCPITIKIRSGPDHNTRNGVEFSRMAEANGAAALAVHGRTWKQEFSGRADWQVVASVKQAVSIPVIGNGDVTSYDQAQKRMAETGCDGVMIGRAALGNPWAFSPSGRPSETADIVRGAVRHLELIETYSPATTGHLAPIKNHLARYFKGFRHCGTIRSRIYAAQSWASVKQLLLSLLKDHELSDSV